MGGIIVTFALLFLTIFLTQNSNKYVKFTAPFAAFCGGACVSLYGFMPGWHYTPAIDSLAISLAVLIGFLFFFKQVKMDTQALLFGFAGVAFCGSLAATTFCTAINAGLDPLIL